MIISTTVLLGLLSAGLAAAVAVQSLRIRSAQTRARAQAARLDALEAIARRAPLETALITLAQSLEPIRPNSRCAVILNDQTNRPRRILASPSLTATPLAPEIEAPKNGLRNAPDTCPCTHASRTGRRVLVHDLASDPAWTTCVLSFPDARIRAIWSEPLLDRDGTCLGALVLCLRRPGTPTPADLTVMENTARLAASTISHAHAETMACEQADLLTTGQRLATLGSFTVDMRRGLWTFSDAWREYAGLPPGPLTREEIYKTIHPDDLRRIQDLINGATTDKPFSYEHRLLNRRTGKMMHVRVYALTKRDQNGVPIQVHGAVQDITDQYQALRQLKLSEDSFRGLFDAMPLLVSLWRKDEQDFVLDALNPAAEMQSPDLVRFDPGTALTKLFQDLPWFIAAVRRCHAETSVVQTERLYPPRGGGEPVHMSFTFAPAPQQRVMVLVENIDVRKRAELRLRDTTALLSEAERLADVGSWEWNLTNDQWKASDNWLDLHGMDATPTSFSDMLKLVHPEDVERVKAMLQAAWDSQTHSMSLRIIHGRTGDVRIMKTRVTLRHDGDGRAVSMRGVSKDITENAQAEQSLRDITNLMIAGQRLGRMVSSEYDVRTETWTMSDTWQVVMGGGQAPTRTEDLLDHIHPEDRDVFLRDFRRALAGQTHRTEYRIRHADTGKTRYIRSFNDLVHDENGQPIRFRAIFQDVTEETERERALTNTLMKLRMAQRIASIGSWIYVPDTNMSDWSEQTYIIFGRDPRLGPPNIDDFKGYYSEEDYAVFRNRFRLALQHGLPYDLTTRVHRSDGSHVWVHVIAQPEETPGASGYIVHGTVQDVTDLKRAEEFREDIERIIRQDLKSPMVAVCSGIDILRMGDNLTDDQRLTLDLMNRATRRQLSVLRTSMALYQMERSTYVVHPEPISLRNLIDEIGTELTPALSTHKATLRVQGDDQMVAGEPQLCHTLFANLLRNAVEALPDRGLTIDVALSIDAGHAVIHITNPGTVPNDVRHRFFEKYATSGKNEGTGLGTYSARLMAKAQGGTVMVDCNQPGSTTLIVRLPLDQKADLAAQA